MFWKLEEFQMDLLIKLSTLLLFPEESQPSGSRAEEGPFNLPVAWNSTDDPVLFVGNVWEGLAFLDDIGVS